MNDQPDKPLFENTPEKQPPPSFVVEYDPAVGFRATIKGEMPIVPLVGMLVTQIVGLCMKQIQDSQRQQILEAQRQGRVFMPDGTPFTH